MTIEGIRRYSGVKAGFTLIELVIVILILSILSIVVITDFVSSTRNMKLQGARFKLKSDLGYVQSLSVAQQIPYGIVFDLSADAYTAYRQTTANIINNPLTLQPFIVRYPTDLNFSGVDLISTSLTSNRVQFDSLGVPSDGTGVLTSDGFITLDYSGNSTTVTVTKNTGRVN